MSADDYMLINYVSGRGRWIVGRGFASDDHAPDVSAESRYPGFTHFLPALEYANSEGAEYGVRFTAAAKEQLQQAGAGA